SKMSRAIFIEGFTYVLKARFSKKPQLPPPVRRQTTTIEPAGEVHAEPISEDQPFVTQI
ncbi:MAG: hypothetical protein H0W02_22315, partial [Ktedonobacteraceae bacterium]|nr:hypothetical protein [Ktedonobacteraceae bacterium]